MEAIYLLGRKCKNCYFYDNCEVHYMCSNYAPYDYTEAEDDYIEFLMKQDKKDFVEDFWRLLYEEDELQEYFG
jgi:hypothetical protein